MQTHEDASNASRASQILAARTSEDNELDFVGEDEATRGNTLQNASVKLHDHGLSEESEPKPLRQPERPPQSLVRREDELETEEDQELEME